jgi:hypothetical protein
MAGGLVCGFGTAFAFRFVETQTFPVSWLLPLLVASLLVGALGTPIAGFLAGTAHVRRALRTLENPAQAVCCAPGASRRSAAITVQHDVTPIALTRRVQLGDRYWIEQRSFSGDSETALAEAARWRSEGEALEAELIAGQYGRFRATLPTVEPPSSVVALLNALRERV